MLRPGTTPTGNPRRGRTRLGVSDRGSGERRCRRPGWPFGDGHALPRGGTAAFSTRPAPGVSSAVQVGSPLQGGVAGSLAAVYTASGLRTLDLIRSLSSAMSMLWPVCRRSSLRICSITVSLDNGGPDGLGGGGGLDPPQLIDDVMLEPFFGQREQRVRLLRGPPSPSRSTLGRGRHRQAAVRCRPARPGCW